MDGLLTAGQLRREALSEWGDWLSGQWEWSWFFTGTFDPKKVRHGTRTTWGWAATEKAWGDFLAWVQPSARGSQGLSGSLWWVRGREPHHDSGGTHFHALIGGLDPTVSRRDAWAWWKDRCGINRIEPYEPSRGAAHYLTKYVVKQLGDVQFSDNLGLHRRVGNDHQR
jgi:hypothetical protein